MAVFVSADWVQENLSAPGSLLIDPRGPMRYMQGHIRGAVNLPAVRLFGRDGQLLSVFELAEFLGSVGLSNDTALTLYDGGDGRNAAMLTWVLEYLGYTDVRIMDIFFEEWAVQGRDKFYRPVRPIANQFTPQVNPRVRATLEEVSAALADSEGGRGGREGGATLLDLRSQAEYDGMPDLDTRPGHIPGAVSLVWQDLVEGQASYLKSPEVLQELLDSRNVGKEDAVIAYCRSGIRASVGYLALQQLGYNVRLYDGSYLEWMNRDMPVETTQPET